MTIIKSVTFNSTMINLRIVPLLHPLQMSYKWFRFHHLWFSSHDKHKVFRCVLALSAMSSCSNTNNTTPCKVSKLSNFFIIITGHVCKRMTLEKIITYAPSLLEKSSYICSDKPKAKFMITSKVFFGKLKS